MAETPLYRRLGAQPESPALGGETAKQDLIERYGSDVINRSAEVA
jgi:hypothetical protein